MRTYFPRQLAILTLLGSVIPLSAVSDCDALFSQVQLASRSRDGTDGMLAYLGQLVERNEIGAEELRALVTAGENAQSINPIAHLSTPYGPVFENASAQIQYETIQKHRQNRLDPIRIRQWAESKLKEREETQVRREEIREDTRSVYQEMKFNRLPPGRLGAVRLTHSFEMMSTQITQKMWVDVMGDNPSHFTEGSDSIVIEINGKKIQMLPDHPVENVTWLSVIVFANRLSEMRGLKPAYDLSGLKTEGRAENGTLSALSGEMQINAPDGDIYYAQGFRLPTAAEQEYVLRDLGRAQGEYPHDLLETQLEDYFWFAENSGDMTQPVGTTRKSLSVDGMVFHDLTGNVAEWSHDLPSGDGQRYVRSFRNGSVFDPKSTLSSASRSAYRQSWNAIYLGARLVRTVEVEPQEDSQPVKTSFLVSLKKWLGWQ